MPSTETVGGRTFLDSRTGMMLLDPEADRVVWRNEEVTVGDLPVVRGRTALLDSTRGTEVDLTTGRLVRQLRFEGVYVVAVGDAVAGVGPEQINRPRY